jgi:uncharacterized protein with ParB-like and HNH nuclease domain
MNSTPRPSREIDGKGRTVRELLSGPKYSIDYYQREYKWQQKRAAELLDDLAAKFLESYNARQELYQKLAEQIWNPDRLVLEAQS